MLSSPVGIICCMSNADQITASFDENHMGTINRMEMQNSAVD